ncbi:MAG: hypothetical protein WD226_02445 [Planctomycetota bacterium]
MDGPDVDLWIELEADVVRVTLAPNLAYLDATLETARENPDFVHPIEAPGLRDALLEYWTEELVVVIDGIRVAPRDAGFLVLEADPSLLPMFPRLGRRALTRVEHQLEYPCKQRPARIEWTWPAFPDDPQNPRVEGGFEPLEINGRLLALERESLLQFSQRDPRFVWVRDEAERDGEPLPVPPPRHVAPQFPVGSLVAFLVGALTALVLVRKSALGAGLLLIVSGGVAFALRPGDAPPAFRVPDEAAALAVFEPLHANLYRAFDYTSEDAIYDALARSAEGPLLDRLYQDVFASLELAEDGGARSFVRSVDPLETRVTGGGGGAARPTTRRASRSTRAGGSRARSSTGATRTRARTSIVRATSSSPRPTAGASAPARCSNTNVAATRTTSTTSRPCPDRRNCPTTTSNSTISPCADSPSRSCSFPSAVPPTTHPRPPAKSCARSARRSIRRRTSPNAWSPVRFPS